MDDGHKTYNRESQLNDFWPIFGDPKFKPGIWLVIVQDGVADPTIANFVPVTVCN